MFPKHLNHSNITVRNFERYHVNHARTDSSVLTQMGPCYTSLFVKGKILQLKVQCLQSFSVSKHPCHATMVTS